jgi:hypothetical protein
MNFALMTIASLACAIFDRVRGSEAHGTIRAICTLMAGSILTMLAAGEYTPFAMVGAFLWWLGEKPGWGTPMGMYAGFKPPPDHKFERWQVTDSLKKNYRLAAGVRGLIWGLPMLVLYSWVPEVVVIPLAMAVAFPAACEFGQWQRRLFNLKRGDYHWVTEYTRGFTCALLVALMSSQVTWT